MYRLTIQYETPADPTMFDELYFDKHVPLCASIPGLQSITVSKPKVLGPGTAPYLVVELDFEDQAAYRSATRSVEMEAVAKDADALPAERVMFVGQLSGN